MLKAFGEESARIGQNQTKVFLAKSFGNNSSITPSLVLLRSSAAELPLKLPFTLPVHILDALELNAGAGFLTTANSAHSLSASSSVAEGLANKQI